MFFFLCKVFAIRQFCGIGILLSLVQMINQVGVLAKCADPNQSKQTEITKKRECEYNKGSLKHTAQLAATTEKIAVSDLVKNLVGLTASEIESKIGIPFLKTSPVPGWQNCQKENVDLIYLLGPAGATYVRLAIKDGGCIFAGILGKDEVRLLIRHRLSSLVRLEGRKMSYVLNREPFYNAISKGEGGTEINYRISRSNVLKLYFVKQLFVKSEYICLSGEYERAAILEPN